MRKLTWRLERQRGNAVEVSEGVACARVLQPVLSDLAQQRTRADPQDNNGAVYCMKCLPRGASFGERLKARRLAAGLTLADLGKQAGLRWHSIGRYEQGKGQPLWETIEKLICVLGVEWLVVK